MDARSFWSFLAVQFCNFCLGSNDLGVRKTVLSQLLTPAGCDIAPLVWVRFAPLRGAILQNSQKIAVPLHQSIYSTYIIYNMPDAIWQVSERRATCEFFRQIFPTFYPQ